MRTEDLVATLAANDLGQGWAGGRMIAALVIGIAAALVGLWIALGPPLAALSENWEAGPFLKALYPLTVTILAAVAALQAGRPGANPWRRFGLLFFPLLAAAIASLPAMAQVPPHQWPSLLFGSTFLTCLTAVALTSVPTFAGLTWAFRLLAPTSQRLAGFLIGLASGGAGAAAYAFYCPELSPAFLFGAYTPAMLIPALLGAWAGPPMLKW